ncbi:MAG TPA: glycosyltransferase family 2 protein [Opitutaceae bacterium]|nr:glycosyltransferase family 2 protein [Opitutaceae bacterium]
MPPLVSILIPCYNAESWLADTLESALGQTWTHREIIVVDDGSRDGSLAVARRFEARGVRVIAQTNRGASAARNAALAASRGDWLQFLDADDLLAPEKIERQLALGATTGPEIVLSGTWARFTGSVADARLDPQPLAIDASPADWVVTKFERNTMMHPAAWLVPRPLAERAGPWNESLSLDDDGEYFTRVVLAAQGVRCCAGAVSYYRSQLANSLSRTKSDAAWSSAFRSLELSVNGLLLREDSPRTRQACANALQRLIYEAYPRAAPARAEAARRVALLGGSRLSPEGGPSFQRVRRLVGWRIAKRLQDWSR